TRSGALPAAPPGGPQAAPSSSSPVQPGAMQGGPYTHRVMSASSPDGLTWTPDGRTLLEHASVPCAVVTPSGALRAYYVDAGQVPETANCAESTDGGATFRVLGLTIEGLPTEKAVDPSIVILPDGRYRLYYFGVSGSPAQAGEHSIYSAVSEDGVHFVQEKEVFRYPGLVDPDVFWTGSDWMMYVFSIGKETIVARSADGLSFEYTGPLSLQRWGTTAPVSLGDGRFRLYAFDQPASTTVASFLSTDCINWTREEGTRLSAPQGFQVTDPFVVRMPDGTWKMVFKMQQPNAGQPAPPPVPPTGY
ncbi:MAG: exo-alpha-sialidase, partial [Actinobacteria bacterium]|nr:exo-alpha-sialidase [Actinomycetota bacterium]